MSRLRSCRAAALAQMHDQHASEAACEEPALRCATKVTPAFAPDGTLWLAWMAGGQVSVASSPDAGRSFLGARRRSRRSGSIWIGGRTRGPKIAIDRKGDIALAFSIFRDKAFNGQVLYTRSSDGGKSFAELRPITANNESQRFEALALDQDGTVFAAWLDKRNRVPVKQARPEIRGRGAVLRVVEGWRRDLPGGQDCASTTPANAVGSGLRSPRPAGRS